MSRWSRRTLLAASVGTAAVALVGCGDGASQPKRRWAPTTPLRIPPETEPTGAAGSPSRIQLTMQTGAHEFLPGHPASSWGINGPILGPTIRLLRGSTTLMEVTNKLPELTTLHWHGLEVPARFDGGPHQPIKPGATWRPTLQPEQPAATLWYHPHPHGATALHVHRGLAGLLLIDDPDTPRELPHNYGIDDIPLVLQDRSIDEKGQSLLDSEPNFGFMGTDICVNATLQPYFEVTTRLVRFRILNGSNARLYHLELSDQRGFACVGNDLGLLPSPVETTRVSLGPGERCEIVIRFEPDEQVTLVTRAGNERIDAGDHNILELRAAYRLESTTSIPSDLGGQLPLTPPKDATVRRFKLQGHDSINGQSMDMSRIDEVVPASVLEVWEIHNTVYSHNFHIHGVSFTVLDVNGEPPPPWAAGRRDTVHLPPRQSVRLAVQFGRHTDLHHPYMYHCHILRHEDAGMMGQFIVVPPNQVSSAPRRLETEPSHHGPR